jgi:hypothetical protein
MVVALLYDSLQGFEPCDVLVEVHYQSPVDRVESESLYPGKGAHRTGDVVDLHHP